MKAAKIVSIVVGSLIGLIALALLVGGGVLLAVYGTQRDSEGFFHTSPARVSSAGYALISPDADVNIGSELRDWLPRGDTGTVRLQAQAGSRELFVGIGPTDQVSQYLGSVARDEITDFGYRSGNVEYRTFSGGEPASPPAEQDFWVAEAQGSGALDLQWEVQDGTWTAVIMNSDATAGVSTDLTLGVKFGFILPIAIGLLIGGLVLLVVAVLLVLLGARRSRPPVPPYQQPLQPTPPAPPPTPPPSA